MGDIYTWLQVEKNGQKVHKIAVGKLLPFSNGHMQKTGFFHELKPVIKKPVKKPVLQDIL